MLDINLNQIKLTVDDTFIKVEKITTYFEPSNDEDVTNKAYLYKRISKIEGRKLFSGEDSTEYNLQNNKRQSEKVVNERTVKSTI